MVNYNYFILIIFYQLIFNMPVLYQMYTELFCFLQDKLLLIRLGVCYSAGM